MRHVCGKANYEDRMRACQLGEKYVSYYEVIGSAFCYTQRVTAWVHYIHITRSGARFALIYVASANKELVFASTLLECWHSGTGVQKL